MIDGMIWEIMNFYSPSTMITIHEIKYAYESLGISCTVSRHNKYFRKKNQKPFDFSFMKDILIKRKQFHFWNKKKININSEMS